MMKRKAKTSIEELREIYALVKQELREDLEEIDLPELREAIILKLIDAALLYRDYQVIDLLTRNAGGYINLMAQILRFWHSGDQEERELIAARLGDLWELNEEKQRNALTLLVSAFAKFKDPESALTMLKYYCEESKDAASQVLVQLVYFGHIEAAHAFARAQGLAEDPEFQYALVSFHLGKNNEGAARQIAAKITDPYTLCDTFLMFAITEETKRTVKTDDLKEAIKASRGIDDPEVSADVLLEVLEEILELGNGAFSVCAFVQECNV